MGPSPRIVVFSNLDGTRFDPYFDVSGQTASLFLPLVRERVPVVFFSSRTRAELEVIQQQLGIRHPFVAENGGALYVPRGYFGFDLPGSREVAGYDAVAYGRPYADVVATLRLTADRQGVSLVGFHDMSVRDVAVDCGLSLLQARLAKLRDHGEPYRVTGPDEGAAARLTQGLRAAKLRCLDTGRYTHAGLDTDQGAIVDLLLSLYRRAFPPALTVGIGDPAADLPLLRRVDIPFIGTTGTMLRRRDSDTRLDVLDRAELRADSLLDIVASVRAGARGRDGGR